MFLLKGLVIGLFSTAFMDLVGATIIKTKVVGLDGARPVPHLLGQGMVNFSNLENFPRKQENTSQRSKLSDCFTDWRRIAAQASVISFITQVSSGAALSLLSQSIAQKTDK